MAEALTTSTRELRVARRLQVRWTVPARCPTTGNRAAAMAAGPESPSTDEPGQSQTPGQQDHGSRHCTESALQRSEQDATVEDHGGAVT